MSVFRAFFGRFSGVFRGHWSPLLALTVLFAACAAQQRGPKEQQLTVGVMQKEIRGGNGLGGYAPGAGLAEHRHEGQRRQDCAPRPAPRSCPFTKELVLNLRKTCNYLQFAQRIGNQPPWAQFPHNCNKLIIKELKLVGTTGFEPATPCTPSKCATRLRHVPTCGKRANAPGDEFYTTGIANCQKGCGDRGSRRSFGDPPAGAPRALPTRPGRPVPGRSPSMRQGIPEHP